MKRLVVTLPNGALQPIPYDQVMSITPYPDGCEIQLTRRRVVNCKNKFAVDQLGENKIIKIPSIQSMVDRPTVG